MQACLTIRDWKCFRANARAESVFKQRWNSSPAPVCERNGCVHPLRTELRRLRHAASSVMCQPGFQFLRKPGVVACGGDCALEKINAEELLVAHRHTMAGVPIRGTARG